MEIPQLDTTNIALGIMAGVAVLQMLGMILSILWVKRTVAGVTKAIQIYQAEQLQPVLRDARALKAQTQDAISEVRALVGRVTAVADGVDAKTRSALATVEAANQRVDAIVHTGLNELHAIEAGMKRTLSALFQAFRP